MESTRFDRLSRLMGRATSRRGALKTIAVGTVGGAALMTASSAHAQNQTADGEEWVQLYEEMAAAVDTVSGPCENVIDAMQAFRTQNADRMQQAREETSAYTQDQVMAHQEAYGSRVQQASIAIHLAMTRCGYVDGSDSPFSVADLNSHASSATPEATPAALTTGTVKAMGLSGTYTCATVSGPNGNYTPTGCDCECYTAFTAANCILWAGGSIDKDSPAQRQAVCYFGICVAGYDHDQCVAQCDICNAIAT